MKRLPGWGWWGGGEEVWKKEGGHHPLSSFPNPHRKIPFLEQHSASATGYVSGLVSVMF